MGYPLLAVHEGDALLSNEVDWAESLLWTQTHHFAAIEETIIVRCLYEAALISPAFALKKSGCPNSKWALISLQIDLLCILVQLL